MNYINADLHCHSVISDGTLSPEELALRAKSNGVDLWSLTDHDEIGGQERAIKAAQLVGLSYLTGTEISVSLQSTRGGRDERALEMSQQLERVGIKGAYSGALKYAGNPELISRTHFARFLVDTGVCSDTSEVFRKYLTDGKPGFVEHKWATLGNAVTWITQAKGVAVIAHPARYGFTPNEEYALFSEFKEHGGKGVEVITGSHTSEEAVRYADVAREFGLCASRGSDFHSPTESRIDLGTLPQLPSDLTPVWSLLANNIH